MLQVGTCAHAPVWWNELDGTVYIAVGNDDVNWDMGATVPLATVHKLLAELREPPNAFTTLKIMWADSGYDGRPQARYAAAAAAVTVEVVKRTRRTRSRSCGAAGSSSGPVGGHATQPGGFAG
jgi:hypothetical protein